MLHILQDCATAVLGIGPGVVNPAMMQGMQGARARQQQIAGLMPGELSIALGVQPEASAVVSVGSLGAAMPAGMGVVGVVSAAAPATAVGSVVSVSLMDMNVAATPIGVSKLGSVATNVSDAAVSDAVGGDGLPAVSGGIAVSAQAVMLVSGRVLEHDKDVSAILPLRVLCVLSAKACCG